MHLISSMFKKLIAIILLVGAAAAEVTFHYEGYCFGKEIPRNYYSLITRERKAVILKEKAYAVVRVTNKTQSDINIGDMKFDISEEEEKIENKPFAGYRYYCKTTGHHCVKPTESYRIFVPIPESKLHGRGKIEAYVYRQINEEDEKVDICTENPLSQKCELVLSEPCYEGLESSLSFFSGVEYTLKLCAVGTAPTYFMYDTLFEISIAIVGANQGKNNRKVGRFGHFEFPCEHVKRAILLPGDQIISTAPVFTDSIWLEGYDGEREGIDLVSCKDVDIIAQDYGMLNEGESEDELELNLEEPVLLNENITVP